MREHPILFNGAMVRAALSGAKTQTRRVRKPQPADDVAPAIFPNTSAQGWRSSLRHAHGATTAHFCPFGQPGDRLWVRETWRGVVNIAPPGSYEYAVARYVPEREHCRRVEYAATQTPDSEPWRPSIQMPRWACRLVLEITDVRVERLQAISEADADAEGANADVLPDIRLPSAHPRAGLPMIYGGPRQIFADLWDTAGGDWGSNPWVWVIEFKRVEVG